MPTNANPTSINNRGGRWLKSCNFAVHPNTPVTTSHRKNVLPTGLLRRVSSPCTAPTISENKIVKYTGPGFMARHYEVLRFFRPHHITACRRTHPTLHASPVYLEHRSLLFLFARLLFARSSAFAASRCRNS